MQQRTGIRAMRIVLSFLLVGVGLAVFVPTPNEPVASAAGVNQYSSPVWFPLRNPTKLGCVVSNCDGGTYHGYWALDLLDPANASGDPVYAAGAGQVTILSTASGCGGPSGGNAVQVNHGNGVQSRYFHLSSIAVGNGAWVDQNTVIGHVGSTGTVSPCPANHLHYEKRVNGSRVNPGPLKACHGSTLVTYPNALGSTNWNAFATESKTLHSDGTTCTAPPSTTDGAHGTSVTAWGAIASGRVHPRCRQRVVARLVPRQRLEVVGVPRGLHQRCTVSRLL